MAWMRRFKGANNLRSSRELYFARKKYDITAWEILNDENALHGLQRTNSAFGADINSPKPTKDFRMGDRAFYGKIDYKGNIITLRDKIDKLGTRVPDHVMRTQGSFIKYGTPNRTLASLTNTYENRPLQAVYFVSEAFYRFVRCYQHACKCEAIKANSPYLRNLRAYKAYEPINAAHQKHQKLIYDGFVKYIVNTFNTNSTCGFNTFVSLFSDYCKLVAPKIPITRVAYMKSNLSSTFNSGLAISVSDLDCGYDQEKIDQFIDDPAYELFMTCAIKHGFSIDKHIPWKLVADLQSPAMIDIMNERGTGNLQIFFNIAYNNAYKDDYTRLKRFLVDSYNSYARSRPKTSEPIFGTDSSGEYKPVRLRTKKRKPVKRSEVDEGYDETYWLEYYLMIRNLEENNQLTSHGIDELTQNIRSLSAVKSPEYLEKYVDDQFKSIRVGGTLRQKLIDRRKYEQHLEEDKLPIFDRINQKDIVKIRKHDTMNRRLRRLRDPNFREPERLGPTDIKRRRALLNNKYGQTRLKMINRYGAVSLSALARLYYKNTENIGGNWIEGEEWYSGAGDLPPGSNGGRQTIAMDQHLEGSSPKFDRIVKQTRDAYSSRDSYNSVATESEESADNLQTSPLAKKYSSNRSRPRAGGLQRTPGRLPGRGAGYGGGGGGGGMGGGGY
jgi:hypothetical protein